VAVVMSVCVMLDGQELLDFSLQAGCAVEQYYNSTLECIFFILFISV
jgi:hypothetical protein